MHQKKSELQIGTESRGVSSDFTRTPPLHHHHHHHHDPFSLYDALNSPTPHKRATTTGTANPGTMNSTPSSLSRSPTLSSLLPTTTTAISTRNQFHHHPQFTIKPSATVLRFLRRLSAHHHYYHHHLKPRLLLPPSLVFAVPAFWYLLRNSNSPSSSFGLWFDFVAALAFAGALVLSFHLSFPRLSLSLAALLRERPRPRFAHSPPVKWTIGSKPISKKPVSADDKEGVVVYSNGDVYEGEFHQGKCSGSGVYYYCMSGRYEGDWVDEKYDGYGVETWARGSRYRGQYRQGLRHGYGVYKFYTGDVYAGEWSNGQSHGYGVHTCEDGSRYVGEFKWGVKHGLGHYHFRNGDTYAGEYFADKMHGFGVYRFANGHRYEGSWHEGRKQGLGMYTFRNGDTHSGCWHNGTLETPSTQSTHPGSPVAVNHSKVLNAVQEARRAAEKAYEVPRVDERVNRAVAAANRAANAARVAAVKAVQKRMHKNDNEYFASEMV